MRIPTALYPNFIGKGDFASPAANSNFENCTLSVQELAANIKLGRAFSPQLKDGKRTSKHFLQSGYLPLDFDNGLTLDEAMADPFIQAYGTIIYTTANHQKEKRKASGKAEPPCDRFRVIFALQAPITDADEYRAACQGLFKLYPQADRSTGDPGRLFCGSIDCNPQVFEQKYLPIDKVKELALTGHVERTAHPASVWQPGDFSTDEVRKMLSCISIDQAGNIVLEDTVGHAAWIRIVFAVASAFDAETACRLIQDWCPDDKGGSYTQTLVDNANGSVTMATLVHHAEKHGYRLPEALERKRFEKGRTPGQVILEDLLAGGKDLVTIAGVLHQYDGKGLHGPVNHGELVARILKYFNTYKTAQSGKTGFATAEAAEKAMNFIIGICKPPADTVINPPGLNFLNGYLRLAYDFKGEPVFDLLPHSPNYVFTYRIAVDWVGRPNTGELEFFDKALEAILPDTAEQQIFMRTVAAAIDMRYVRSHLKSGRTIKALILEGEGTNGKDTLHVWTEELFGGHGMSCVTMRTFKDADEGRIFGMVPLATSLINWSPENGKILLDEAESLKAFITGDSGVRAARKHQDEFVIEPKAVCIFNVNKLPAVKSAMEAINARYSMIRLKTVFKTNPDPSNPRHKKGDARYKDNLEFIRENLLQAYAYRVVEAYRNLLSEGIDYSATIKYLDEVRKESNHLHAWLEAQNLVLCPASEGMPTTQCYQQFYLPWARNEDYIQQSGNFGSLTYHHPNERYDKVITNPNQLLQRLKEALPSIEYKRTNQSRKIGLKCLGSPQYPFSPSLIESVTNSMT